MPVAHLQFRSVAIAALIACAACSHEPGAQQRAALAASLESKAATLNNSQPYLAVLLAAQAYRFSADDASHKALRTALQANPALEGFLPQTDPVRAVDYANKGATLITAGEAGTICVWDLKKRTAACSQLAETKVELQSLAAASGPTLAAVVADSSGHVRYVDLSGATPDESDLGGGIAVVYSPDGTQLAAGKSGGTVRLWSTLHEKPEPDAEWEGNRAAVRSLAFNFDGTHLVSVDATGLAVLHQVAEGKVTEIKHEFGASPAILTAIGHDLAAISGVGGGGKIALWNLETKALRTIDVAGGAPTSIAFTPDGTILAAVSSAGEVTLWTVADAKIVETIHTGADPLRSLVFHPDGVHFAAVSEHGAHLFTRTPGPIADTADLAALACQRAGRNLSQAEWTQYVGKDADYRATCANLPPPAGVKGK